MQTNSIPQPVSHNVMMFGDRRVINVKGPDFHTQFDMLPGETADQALRRHYLALDHKIDRLVRQRSRIVAVVESRSA
jgi:hypothetical protein